MATENRITIEFTAKGDKALRAAILNLDKAMKKATGSTKKFGKETKKAAMGSRLLSNSFATIRSKMLLASFAMSMGVRQLIQFTKEAAKVQGMERAFTNLSGGTLNAGKSMDSLREATNNTMSDFDLFQQANNAMILGVTSNTEEMGKMFDMAQRLGAALGKDTKQSVESLITGMGRQSKLMLDNIGIVVDVNKAYKDYAATNETTVDALTDVERKQAFMNATLEAGESKLQKIGDEVLLADAHFQRFGAASKNLSVTFGEALLPLVKPLADAMVLLSNSIKPEDIYRLITAVSASIATMGVGKVATLGFAGSMDVAAASAKRLGVALIKNRVTAIVVAMAAGITVVLDYFGAFEEGEQVLEGSATAQQKFAKSIGMTVEQLKKLQGDIDSLMSAQTAYSLAVTEAKGLQDNLTDAQISHSLIQQKLIKNLEKQKILKENGLFNDEKGLELVTEEITLNNDLIKSQRDMDEAQKQLSDTNKKKLEEEEKNKQSLLDANQLTQLRIKHFDDEFEAEKQVLDVMEKRAQAIKNTEERTLALSEVQLQRLELEDKIVQSNIDAANKDAAAADALAKKKEDIIENTRVLQLANEHHGNAIALTEAEIEHLETLKQSTLDVNQQKLIQAQIDQKNIKLTDQRLSQKEKERRADIQKISDFQSMARAASTVSSAIIQLAEGNKKATLRGLKLSYAATLADSIAGIARAFKTDGIVGYAAGVGIFANMVVRLSQINQQIRAAEKMESGGLVGGRRHSQGGTLIEAEQGEFVMSRSAVEAVGIENMNRINRGGGAITVNVSGNVMTQDFVEGDLAEAIRNAARRGTDFGVS